MSNGPDEARKAKEYSIGYGKPPQWSRFVKGKSGNPLGRKTKKSASRPRSAKLDKAVRDQILAENNKIVSVREGDRHVQMTTVEAIRQAERVAAFKGNAIAQRNALARYEIAASELAAEIEEDHSYWRTYCAAYRQKERDGYSLPEDIPHPDDLIFKDGKFVTFVWTPKLAAEKRHLIQSLLLQAEKDTRALCTGPDIAHDPKPLSLVLALVLNNLLPPRYRFDDVQLLMIMDKYRAMTKRRLETALKEALLAAGLPYHPNTVLPAAEPNLEWLTKYLALATRKLRAQI